MVKRASTTLATVVLMSIFVLAILCVHVAHAILAEVPCITVSPSMYVAEELGEVFTVDIDILNASNLRVFEFKLGYNATVLDAVDVVEGSFFPSPPKAIAEKLEIDETTGFVWARFSISDSEPAVSGSGTLVTISFNATLAPEPPEEAWSLLDLRDSLLYGDSMTVITHESTGGLYFWRSVQPDPPIEGRMIDLYTQKGGKGQGVSGGVFTIAETVELTANLTYNGYPVQHKLVGFGVSGPIGSGGLVGTAFSNDSGFATIEFRMPSLPESFGTWMVFSNSQVADIIVWDFLTFEVVSVPPRSPKADFIEIPHEALAHEQIYFDASSSEPGFDGDDESPIVEYRWDFGDGNQTITTIPIIYHAYSNAGVYYVTLTVFAPGIPSFIDPQYIDTNITYPPQRKLIHGSSVGGYSHPFENSAETNLVAHVFVPAEMLAITFVVLGRKRTRTKLQALKSRFCHF